MRGFLVGTVLLFELESTWMLFWIYVDCYRLDISFIVTILLSCDVVLFKVKRLDVKQQIHFILLQYSVSVPSYTTTPL